MIRAKNIVLGVSGGIAAYKSCEIVSSLVKLGAGVDVIMTANAEHFVTPLTFETLSGRQVVRGMFEERKEFDVRHVSLAKKADILVVAPATADVIAKFARGIADDMLSTVWLAAKCPRMVCPAMNTGMWTAEATQQNLRTLLVRGVRTVGPDSGHLACGDSGNDLSMIECAGVGVVMGNARAEIQEHADLIAPTNQDEGVAQILEQYVLQR